MHERVLPNSKSRKPRSSNTFASPEAVTPGALSQDDEDGDITDESGTIITENGEVNNGTPSKFTKSEKRRRRQAAKVSKERDNHLKRQANCAAKQCTPAEVDQIALAIHETSNMHDDATGHGTHRRGIDYAIVAKNIGYNSSLQHHTKWLSKSGKQAHISQWEKGSHAKSTPNTPQTYSKELKDIALKLGVNLNTVFPKNVAPVVKKLVEAVESDLVCCLNEKRATMIRAAGYWRYANKAIYNDMVKNNIFRDWETGKIIDETTEDAGVRDDIYVRQDDEIDQENAEEDVEPAEAELEAVGEQIAEEAATPPATDLANLTITVTPPTSAAEPLRPASPEWTNVSQTKSKARSAAASGKKPAGAKISFKITRNSGAPQAERLAAWATRYPDRRDDFHDDGGDVDDWDE